MMAYEHETYIREALDALLAQTCMDFKLVSIDDGSKDGTYSILKEYEAGPLNGRMTVLTHPCHSNCGIYAGYRRCLEELDTEFFMPHASDDFLLPDAIEYFLSLMDENQDVDFIYGPCYIVDSSSTFTGALDGTIDIGQGIEAFSTLLRSNPVREPSMLFRAKCAYIIQKTKTNIAYGDWLHNLALFSKFKAFRYDRPSVAYRHHENNFSMGRNASNYNRNYGDVLSAALANIPLLLDFRLDPLIILAGSSISPPPCKWPTASEAEARVHGLLGLYSYPLLRSLLDRKSFAALPAALAACVIARAGWLRGGILTLNYVFYRHSLSATFALVKAIASMCTA